MTGTNGQSLDERTMQTLADVAAAERAIPDPTIKRYNRANLGS